MEPVFLRSLNLKWPDPTGTEHNLGYVKVNGGVWFDAASWQLKTPEAERLAETYGQDVATAMGGEVRTFSSRGSWSVYVEEKPLPIEKALAHSQNWLSAMRQFIDAVADLQRRTLVD